MTLPERPPPRRLTPTARAHLGRIASALLWRTLHPTERGPFVEAAPPGAARRLYYTASDGWRAPVFRIDPPPGPWPIGAGEPVLLAHGLTAGPDLFRYGERSLVASLREAGFAVYLWTHRADRQAVAPPGGRSRDRTVERIVERDLPPALEVVAEHSGFQRVHLVGHGLGGLLALAAGSRREPRLASVVALGAPLELPELRPDGAALTRLLSWLPASWPVPLRTAARLTAPLLGGRMASDLAPRSPSARVRGALLYAVEDPPVALVQVVRGWMRSGAPALYGGAVELCEGLAAADVPLLVVTATDDPICPPDVGERALGRWGHADRTALRASGSHLDLVLGSDAPAEVFDPVARWIGDRRRRSWSA
ncbi:MAG: alpha/beta fold hydrolase [Myxococcota bacterium]